MLRQAVRSTKVYLSGAYTLLERIPYTLRQAVSFSKVSLIRAYTLCLSVYLMP
jgi:hypothetical protein